LWIHSLSAFQSAGRIYRENSIETSFNFVLPIVIFPLDGGKGVRIMTKPQFTMTAAFAARMMLVACTVSVAGCASRNDFGDRLQEQGAAATDIAQQYKKGQRLVKDGEADIRSGRKLVSKGEGRVRDGQNLVERGNAMQAQALAAYCGQTGHAAPECR
jgi:hypothetical protein